VTEDIAIAALLHDAVEDEGGIPRLRDIEAKFGQMWRKMVEGCTDSFEKTPAKKEPWEEERFLRRTASNDRRHIAGVGGRPSCTTPGQY